jgi:tetratricopeptide (TPR) repeat protein
VINNLEYVYSINPFYANGTALQTLYESYMERGDIRTATGELEAALEDFKKAAEISLQADSTVLKLYFARVKIAELQGMLSEYSVAVNNYKEAVELINLLPLLEVEDKNRAFLLQEAERYADIEWYRTSYRLYRQVLPASDIIFETSEVVIIKEGDYLSRLANLYNTTVQEILDANELPNINSIQLGQEIKIPVLKKSD